MKGLKWTILLIALYANENLIGQEVHHFTKGLILGSSPRYGRYVFRKLKTTYFSRFQGVFSSHRVFILYYIYC